MIAQLIQSNLFTPEQLIDIGFPVFYHLNGDYSLKMSELKAKLETEEYKCLDFYPSNSVTLQISGIVIAEEIPIISDGIFFIDTRLSNNVFVISCLTKKKNKFLFFEYIIIGFDLKLLKHFEIDLGDNINILDCKFSEDGPEIVYSVGSVIKTYKNKNVTVLSNETIKGLNYSIHRFDNTTKVLISDKEKFLLCNLGFDYTNDIKMNFDTKEIDSNITSNNSVISDFLTRNSLLPPKPVKFYRLISENNKVSVFDVELYYKKNVTFFEHESIRLPNLSKVIYTMTQRRVGYFLNNSFISKSEDIEEIELFEGSFKDEFTTRTSLLSRIYISFANPLAGSFIFKSTFERDFYSILKFNAYKDTISATYARLNDKEKEYLKEHPIDSAIGAYLGMIIAYKKSASLKEFEGSLRNTPRDSIRHAYWASLMTTYLGSKTAKDILDNHEYSRNDPYDDYNNRVGIYLGKLAKKSNLSNNELFEIIRDAERKGLLANNKNSEKAANQNFIKLKRSKPRIQRKSSNGRDFSTHVESRERTIEIEGPVIEVDAGGREPDGPDDGPIIINNDPA
ncbi:hypothetical protein KH5_12790 [Urechidicola sp. KH5]